ncbi:MAG: ACP phosphodiesterase [Gammaproteobacteria bacterium]|nr:ACP phosphodiesterase [Gammaproteobacteria bacterium]
MMNYFAHLVLSQPTVESTVGNLLGDFARGIDQSTLSPAVLAGLKNHRAVDRFTDSHPKVKAIKQYFSKKRRRFAGIALDVYFDHLLVNHWHKFDPRNLDDVIAEFYLRMEQGQTLMPGSEMRRVTSRMISHDWFGSYQDIDSVAEALDRIATRIRFPNSFDNAIEDLRRNEDMILNVFDQFFPQLKAHVESLGFEKRLAID